MNVHFRKRNIVAMLLCLCLILSGCIVAKTPAEAPTAAPVPETTEHSVTETAEQSVPETAESAGNLKLLSLLPGVSLGTVGEYDDLYSFGENLLVVSGAADTLEARLMLISPEDGSVLTSMQTLMPEGSLYEASFTQDHMLIFGQMEPVYIHAYILDASLSKVGSYDPPELSLQELGYPSVDQPMYFWHSPDYQVGYTLCYAGEEDGRDISDLLRVDIATGTVTKLATHLVWGRLSHEGGQYAAVNYENPEGISSFSLDVYTGQLEEAPMEGELLDRIGDTWLLRDGNDDSTLHIHTPEGTATVCVDDPWGRICLMNEGHLFAGTYSGGSGVLYDTSGERISSYEIPGFVEDEPDQCSVSGPVWSETTDGYYLVVKGISTGLYFWDIHA